MRRKLSKLLLMITVACMSVMTLVLAACSTTSTEPQKPAQDTTKVNAVTMLKDVISNLKASYALDKTFGIDVAAKYLQDDKNDDTEDAKFELIAKGNVDVNDDANENATNFVIELNKVGESKETMFGIAYEVIDGKPYFFVNLLNGGYQKINGFSILSLYKMANAQVAGGAEGINIESLIAYVAPILFGDTGKVDSGVYTFNFDLANLVNEIEGFIPLLTGALNMSTEDLDSLVAIFCKNMTFSSGEAVDSLADLVDYVNTEMSFSGTIAVKFDANKKFTSSSLTFDYANGDEGKTYTFSVDKAFVGTTNTPIDTFNGFALTEDARKQNQAYNLLNFSLDGEAMAIGGAHDGVKYSINVESDLDPFVFFGLLESTSKENILACLNKMGYFHLQIDELQADGQVKNNVITIHTKSEEGFAVISVNPYPGKVLVPLPLGIGGVYNFDALIDVIGMLTAPKGATATADGGINIGALLSQIMGYIHADDIATNGVTIDLKALVHGLLPALGVALDDTLGGIVDAVLGSDSMNIKLATPTFGTCQAVETAELVNSLASIRTKYKANGEDYIKEITSVENFIATTVLQGDDLFEKYLGKANNGAYPGLKGMSIDNKEVDTSGYIMGIQGYDANKAGKQKVTLYIAVATDVKYTLVLASGFGIKLEVDPLIPLSGVLKYETEIDVLAFESSRNVEIKNMKEGYVVLKEGANLISELQTSSSNKLIMSIDGLEFPIDDCTISVFENGKDVTEQVYVNKKIAKHGYYTVKFDYRGYCVEKVIGVAGIETTGEKTEIKLGTEFPSYKFVTYAENGEKQYPEATLSYKLGSTTKNESDLFDNQEGKLILKKDMDFVGKTLNVVLSYNGLEITDSLKIVGAKVSTKPSSSIYFLDNKKIEFAVNIDNKVFSVKYDLAQAKWIAVSGEETKEVAVTLEWKKKGSGDNVQFDEKGQIVYKNENISGSRSNKVYYTITIDGYYYSSYFTVNELYANNKTSHKIANTLDGYISYVDKIYYEKDGQKVTLEFKYGKDGYAIYEKGTDNKVYDVTVKVTKDSQDVQLVDGKFTELGTYRVEYDLTINGANQKFYHDVTVK